MSEILIHTSRIFRIHKTTLQTDLEAILQAVNTILQLMNAPTGHVTDNANLLFGEKLH